VGGREDGARFDVFNPATGEVIATAPDSKRDFLEKKSVYPNLS
jgi:acyl-CoA reductase-like NAD-dependent aldehyde dehydrogenase